MNNQRKRVAKRLASGLLAGAVAFGGLAISGSSPAGAVPVELDSRQRLAGADRYETSAVVAEELEDQLALDGDDIETVIVANGENFPDALSAAALAGSSAPILLVESDSIPSSVLQRMGRLSSTVTDVYVVGGTSAVSEAVFAQVEGIFDDADVTRLSGDDRYGTSLAIADEVGNDTGAVLIASGTGFADAVSIGSFAAANAYPILLAGPSGLDADTIAWIETAVDDEDLARAIIIGGPAAVSADVEAQLAEAGVVAAGISRVAGPDRYLTNLLWNLEEFGAKTTKHLGSESPGKDGVSIMLVTGDKFPDALAAAPLAAKLNSHVVLTNPQGGGASWLTIAATIPTAIVSDDAAAAFSMAAFTDNSIFGALPLAVPALASVDPTAHAGQDLWVIGGTNAVPAAVVTAGETAAAGSAVTCTVTIGGSNGVGGPTSAVVSFSKPLQKGLQFAAPAPAPAGTIIDTEIAASFTGEVTNFENSANWSRLFNIDGSSLDDVTAIDNDKDGIKDALLVEVNDQLDIADGIEFKGVDQDTDDYDRVGSTAVFNGTFLRDFDSCSGAVAKDVTGPKATIWPILDWTGYFVFGGSAPSAANHMLFIEFNSALSSVSSAAYDTALETDVTNSIRNTNGVSPTNVDCQINSALTAASCSFNSTLSADTAVTLSAASYRDVAGNVLSNGLTAVAGGTSAKLWSYDTDYDDAPGISATSVCAKLGTGGMKAGGWSGPYGDGYDGDDAGYMLISTGVGVVTLAAKSGHAGLDANLWSFTIEHERGLVLPQIAVDGTDVTITIDRFFHTGDDVARIINGHPTIGRGGLAPLWSVTSDGGLIEVSDIDTPLTTENSGTEATQSCYIKITLDSPIANGTGSAGTAPVVSAGIPDAANEIRVSIGGEDQVNASAIVDEVEVFFADEDTYASDSGRVLYVKIGNTTSTGTIRVSMNTSSLYLLTAVKTVTAS